VRRRLAVALGVGLAALTNATAASAMDSPIGGHDMSDAAHEDDISIQFAAFAPERIDVVAGDTVRWTNNSVRVHTVNAVDGPWSSPRIVGTDSFSHEFDTPGATPYYCVLHPFMRGEVDVHNVLIAAPTEPGAPGRPYTLRGRSALPPGQSVAIEADTGAGFQPAGTATVENDGSFASDVIPSATATYRAVAGTDASPSVQLLVLNRKLTASGSTRGHSVTVNSKVAPGAPGSPVVLQLRLPLHFGWWPVARAKLDHHSTARFALKLAHRYPARVVLTLADGATVLATSRTLHVGPR
jgi:plastocyanin